LNRVNLSSDFSFLFPSFIRLTWIGGIEVKV
jgi:hypothetical protein